MTKVKYIHDKKNIIFGTDGWRGLDGQELNADSVGLVAAALAEHLKKCVHKPSAAVGYDGRRNSELYADVICRVLNAAGVESVMSDKVISTPMLSFFTKDHKLSAGVMVTASHNPPAYNGIKFKGPYGGPYMTEETRQVEELISDHYSISDYSIKCDMRRSYFDHIRRNFDFSEIRRAGLIPLVDSMGGAGMTYLEEILNRNSCSAETIFGTADADFYHRIAEPIEKNLRPLSDMLAASDRFCCGFATDGDADRLGVIMENGEWLSAQETILYLNDYMVNMRKLPGGLVKTSSVTDKLRLFESAEHPVYDVQVGFKYICEMMLKHDILIGCEESGGFGFRDHIPERDGIYSACMFLEMLAVSGYSRLSDFVKAKRRNFGIVYYDRIDHYDHSENRIEKLPELFERNLTSVSGYDVQKVESFKSSRGIVNGLKYYLGGGCRWLLMRASETEPMVRLYAEGQSDREVKDILQTGKGLIA